jgi:hypothetical protein
MATFRYDVFTDTPLAGNQLAVFTDARELPEELLARERKHPAAPFAKLLRGRREKEEAARAPVAGGRDDNLRSGHRGAAGELHASQLAVSP